MRRRKTRYDRTGRAQLIDSSLLLNPYEIIKDLAEYEDTGLEPNELSRLVPHICSCCIGCEVEPEDGHGCDGYDSFVISPDKIRMYIMSIAMNTGKID